MTPRPTLTDHTALDGIDPPAATDIGRVRFRAWRRGFREADLILGPFADAHAPSMSAVELVAFERLLEQSDHDIYGWIVGSIASPPPFDDDLLSKIRAFRPPVGQGA